MNSSVYYPASVVVANLILPDTTNLLQDSTENQICPFSDPKQLAKKFIQCGVTLALLLLTETTLGFASLDD